MVSIFWDIAVKTVRIYFEKKSKFYHFMENYAHLQYHNKQRDDKPMDAGTDFRQARPIVNTKAFKNDF